MKSNSHVVSFNTAIKRSGPSSPLRYIEKLLNKDQAILDYGCGHGADVKHLTGLGYSVFGFDPHWNPIGSSCLGKFDIVLCTYVLNVLPKKEEAGIILDIKNSLEENGRAFVSVRRDSFREGLTSRGYQRFVELDYPILYKKSGAYTIYDIR